MFIGRYYNQLESKGRVCLPKQIRQGCSDWVITRGFDGGLFLFPSLDFQNELAKMDRLQFTKANHRNLIRLLTNEAQNVTTDKTGRILIPEHLQKLAQLKKSLVVVGSLSRVEIWDRDLYHQFLDNISQSAESIAETIAWTEAEPINSALPSPRSLGRKQ